MTKRTAQQEQQATGPTMDPGHDAADTAHKQPDAPPAANQGDPPPAATDSNDGAADQDATKPATLPVLVDKPLFTETDLGRVQALPDLSEAPEVAEAIIPDFAPGAIQFFKDTAGITRRVVAVNNAFYTLDNAQ